MMPHTHTHTRLAGCLLAFTAVLLGAFGAHALNDYLQANHSLDTWQTAVRYQIWHALALILCSVMPLTATSRAANRCFLWGSVLFSGSLYVLALQGPEFMGLVTPLGGLLLLLGWLLLAVRTFQASRQGAA